MTIVDRLVAVNAPALLIQYVSHLGENLSVEYPIDHLEDRLLLIGKQLTKFELPLKSYGGEDPISPVMGEKFSIAFQEFCRISVLLPRKIINEILDGTVKTLPDGVSHDISAQYSLVTNLCYEMKRIADVLIDSKIADGICRERAIEQVAVNDEYKHYCDNFMTFLMDNFCREFVIMGAREFLAVFRLPMPAEIPSWDRFSANYMKFVVNA